MELGHSENRDTKRDKLSTDFSVFSTYRDSINWQNDLTLNQQNSLILGGDWYEDRIHSDKPYNENSRWNRAAFIQHRFKGSGFPPNWGYAATRTSNLAGRTVERYADLAGQ